MPTSVAQQDVNRRRAQANVVLGAWRCSDKQVRHDPADQLLCSACMIESTHGCMSFETARVAVSLAVYVSRLYVAYDGTHCTLTWNEGQHIRCIMQTHKL